MQSHIYILLTCKTTLQTTWPVSILSCFNIGSTFERRLKALRSLLHLFSGGRGSLYLLFGATCWYLQSSLLEFDSHVFSCRTPLLRLFVWDMLSQQRSRTSSKELNKLMGKFTFDSLSDIVSTQNPSEHSSTTWWFSSASSCSTGRLRLLVGYTGAREWLTVFRSFQNNINWNLLR